MNIYIWGTGRGAHAVLSCLKKDRCDILGFIDNNPEKQHTVFENSSVLPFEGISQDFDYIIISIIQYKTVLYQLGRMNFTDLSRVIVFYDEGCCGRKEYESILDAYLWKITLLEQKVADLETKLEIRVRNAGYEIADGIKKEKYQFPKLAYMEEAVYKIIHDKCSFVRYGDGEFEIMAGQEHPVFQKYQKELAERLREVLKADDERLLIGIADNYGCLDRFPADVADGIRLYMTDEIRKYHMSVLESDRIYYDAYMFKAFYPHRDREHTKQRIDFIKQIWNQRDVVIIEGDKTRAGYGNDLFDNAASLKRILAPTQNAFDMYEDILNAALCIDQSCLILVILGPAAEPLVYDLMRSGYQAVDIGQIDMDYEWYLAGAGFKVPIPDKYVSQLPPVEVRDLTDEAYNSQILKNLCEA